MGIGRYPYLWQGVYPPIPRTPRGPHSHHKTWFDWNEWWQLLVNPTWVILHGLQIFHTGPRCHRSVLQNGLFCVFLGSFCHPYQPDPQVVSYVLWSAIVGSKASRLAYNPTTKASPHSPCLSSRDLFLYYYWVVELSTWSDQILAVFRVADWENNWG